MQAAVTLVMMDVVRSRKIQQAFAARVGDKGNRAYSDGVLTPCRQRIMALLNAQSGKLHDGVGDQFAAYFDYAQDALAFSLQFQRELQSSPIAVPEESGCTCLQMRTAVGTGSMER